MLEEKDIKELVEDGVLIELPELPKLRQPDLEEIDLDSLPEMLDGQPNLSRIFANHERAERALQLIRELGYGV